jgi:hypothetical protein
MVGETQALDVLVTIAGIPRRIRLEEHDYGSVTTVFKGSCAFEGDTVELNLAGGRQGRDGRLIVTIKREDVPECSKTISIPHEYGVSGWDKMDLELPLPPFPQFWVEGPAVGRPPIFVKIERESGVHRLAPQSADVTSS